MNEFLHIHLPCDDSGIQEIEKALGVKFQVVVPEMVPSELVDVCPMPEPTMEFITVGDDIIPLDYMELKYKKN